MHSECMQQQTSIRVSTQLLNVLKKFKERQESYEDVIWDFIEPHLELSEEAVRDMELSEREYREGKVSTLEEIKQKFGF